MNKLLKKLFATAILIAALLPSSALAVWWNPLSWFERPNNASEQAQEQAVEVSTSTLDSSDPEEPAEDESVMQATAPNTQEFQSRIAKLTEENEILKERLSAVSESLSQTANQYNEVATKYDSMVNALPIFEENLKAMITPVVNNLNSCRAALGLATLSQFRVPSMPYYPPIRHSISCRSSSLYGTTYTTCY